MNTTDQKKPDPAPRYADLYERYLAAGMNPTLAEARARAVMREMDEERGAAMDQGHDGILA